MLLMKLRFSDKIKLLCTGFERDVPVVLTTPVDDVTLLLAIDDAPRFVFRLHRSFLHSVKKGENKVLMLTPACDLAKVKAYMKQVNDGIPTSLSLPIVEYKNIPLCLGHDVYSAATQQRE